MERDLLLKKKAKEDIKKLVDAFGDKTFTLENAYPLIQASVSSLQDTYFQRSPKYWDAFDAEAMLYIVNAKYAKGIYSLMENKLGGIYSTRKLFISYT